MSYQSPTTSIPQYRDPTPWYLALASRYGVVLKTNDMRGAMARLYGARKLAADPDLEGLSLRPSPERKDEILIIKNGNGNGRNGNGSGT